MTAFNWDFQKSKIDKPEEKTENEEESDSTMMECVYASPEYFFGCESGNVINGEYPLIHIRQPDELQHDEAYMEEVYASPEMMGQVSVYCTNSYNFCGYCGNQITKGSIYCNKCGCKLDRKTDLDETVQLCRFCGKTIPMIFKFCSYCGRQVR